MNRLIILAAILLPVALQGQTIADTESDFQTRTGVQLDWKLTKGLHLEGGYELRTKNNFANVGSNRASIGLDWTIVKGLKAGAEYTYIYHHKTGETKNYWTPRHRFSASLGYTFKAGDWRINLKETLRYTIQTESLNTYQEPQNPITLKSRVKVSYKGSKVLTPYAEVEIRNLLNSAGVNANYNAASNTWSDYSFPGYGWYPPYVNRVRGTLGLEWKLSRHHALDFALMEDYCYERKIDVNAAGDTLKEFTLQPAWNTILSVGYKISF